MSDQTLRERVAEIICEEHVMRPTACRECLEKATRILALLEGSGGWLRKAAQKVANRMSKILDDGCECDAGGCVCGYNEARHEWAELDAALRGSPPPAIEDRSSEITFTDDDVDPPQVKRATEKEGPWPIGARMCDCTSYNGGPCYNCINGAHSICGDGQGRCSLSSPPAEPSLRADAVRLRDCLRALTDGTGDGDATLIAEGRAAVIATGYLDRATPPPATLLQPVDYGEEGFSGPASPPPASLLHIMSERSRAAESRLAIATDALQSILNVEGAALEGARYATHEGLDVPYRFQKVRKALDLIERAEKQADPPVPVIPCPECGGTDIEYFPRCKACGEHLDPINPPDDPGAPVGDVYLSGGCPPGLPETVTTTNVEAYADGTLISSVPPTPEEEP